jgi:hypothetical protein
VKLHTLPCCKIWGSKSCSTERSKIEGSHIGPGHLIKGEAGWGGGWQLAWDVGAALGLEAGKAGQEAQHRSTKHIT